MILIIGENPSATVAQASKRLGVGMATINRDRDALKRAGKLEREGSSKAGVWKVLSV